MKKVPGSCLVLHALLLAASHTKGDILYSITDLGTLDGDRSYGTAINNSALVAGYFRHPDDNDTTVGHGFVYAGSSMTAIPTLGGTNNWAHDTNDLGWVVGTSRLADETTRRGFLYDGTNVTALGTLGGQTSYASGINSSGTIVGWANPSGSSAMRAVRWDGGATTELATLGGASSDAYGINDAGVIVGWSNPTGSNAQHAVVWAAGGGIQDVGTLGGTDASLYRVNDAGNAVGWSDTAGDSTQHAMLYDGSTLTDLGTLGGTWSQAWAINDGGVIVGSARTAAAALRAFVVIGGVMYDLNNMIDPASGWTLNAARDINDLGSVVGYGTYEGSTRAFLLTPIPEPPSQVSLLIGIAALLAVVIRRLPLCGGAIRS